MTKSLRNINIPDHLTDAIFILDHDHNILRTNKAAMAIFGKGNDLDRFKCFELLKKRAEPCDDCPLSGSVLHGTVQSIDYFDSRYDEFFEERTIPVTEESNMDRVEGFILIVRNYTDIHNKKLAEFQKMKFDILEEIGKGISHDFNNVFTGIWSQLDLLKMKHPDEPDHPQFDTIRSAVDKGLVAVQNMANFSRISNDDKPEDINIKSIINDIISTINEKLAEIRFSQGIIIDPITHVDDHLWISGYREDILSAVNNILNNAIDAMPDGGVLNIQAFEKDEKIILKISDSGTGMSQSVKEKIFTPFFTTKGPEHAGHGMGHIYGSMKRNKGSVDVNTIPGKGTEVILSFPPVSPIVGETKDDVPQNIQVSAATIMVVDDEKYILEGIDGLLTNLGHKSEIFQSPIEAYRNFRPGTYDLVILDMGMPEMTGLDLATKVKKIDPKLPIILFSGWSIYLQESPELQDIIDFKLTKPFTVTELTNVIAKALSMKSRKMNDN